QMPRTRAVPQTRARLSRSHNRFFRTFLRIRRLSVIIAAYASTTGRVFASHRAASSVAYKASRPLSVLQQSAPH
ncbi:MAG: hypothetical protein WBW73_24190, partial [Rhodoplanes sp.]